MCLGGALEICALLLLCDNVDPFVHPLERLVLVLPLMPSDFGALPMCGFHSLGWVFRLLPFIKGEEFCCAHMLSTHSSRGRNLRRSSWHEPWFYMWWASWHIALFVEWSFSPFWVVSYYSLIGMLLNWYHVDELFLIGIIVMSFLTWHIALFWLVPLIGIIMMSLCLIGILSWAFDIFLSLLWSSWYDFGHFVGCCS